MATSDPIADMLTRIRNAARAGKKRVRVKRSKVCLGISQVLREEGYIREFDSIDDTNQGEIRIDLKYGDRGESVFQDLQRVLDGLGIAIVSTSRGVLSDRQCRELDVGGELLCTVW